MDALNDQYLSDSARKLCVISCGAHLSGQKAGTTKCCMKAHKSLGI